MSDPEVVHKDGTVDNADFKREAGEHGHADADIKLIADLLGIKESDPLQQAKPHEALNAVAIADMAARSVVDNGRVVTIDECGQDYPPPQNLFGSGRQTESNNKADYLLNTRIKK